MDHIDACRATRSDAGVELLGHPVGERANFGDMGDHRPAPADCEAAFVRRQHAARAEHDEFARVIAVGFQRALGDVEHPTIERAGEALLGADRNDEMAAWPGARPRGRSSTSDKAWPIAAPTVAA